MSSINSIKIRTCDFPDNIKGIDRIFHHKNLGEKSYYLLIEHGVKIDISDLNIDIIKKDLPKDKEIEIFAEKFEIKLNYFVLYI